MEREKITLTVSELQDIVFEESAEFEVIETKTVGHWRHGSEECTVVQRLSDNKYFELNWRNSVKDSCEFEDMNYDDEYKEVFPEKVETIIYK